MGIIDVFFKICGNLPCKKIKLINLVKIGVMTVLLNFMNEFGISSGLLDLLMF